MSSCRTDRGSPSSSSGSTTAADVSREEYRSRVELYRDLGCNILRVWGGGFLERSEFYDLCDEHGILVWQEFPLSSSGIDNVPPDDPQSIEDLSQIARSYILRRHHHVSLALWCGGNELAWNKDRDDQMAGRPIGLEHPLLAALDDVVRSDDRLRRFLPTSPYGPRFGASAEEYGKGVHWDVHGPWRVDGGLSDGWTRFWAGDDALLHSEIGAPGPSSEALINRYRGACEAMPVSLGNPLWRRNPWWIEIAQFEQEHGRSPESLGEYVEWGQARQAAALAIAARASKERFPACAGFIVWMGHDCFPCTANTSIIDFDGCAKPAATALAAIFRGPPSAPP